MARKLSLGVRVVVRGRVRRSVRGSDTDDDIVSDIQSSFPNLDEDDIRKIIADERRIQGAIAGIHLEDKRSNVDLARRLKCKAGTSRIRVYMSITFPTGPKGETKTYTDTVEIDARGRLQDLLNDAIAKVVERAVTRGYAPPHITSSQTSGSVRYRIERMDCI